MYFTDQKQRKGKEKGKERGGRGGKGTAVGEEIWGVGTQTFGTWRRLGKELPPAPGAQLVSEGEGGERGAGGGGRVPAEVDGRGPGLTPRWEPRVGATPLSTARSSCAPRDASLGRGLAGVGKVCEKRGQLVAPKCTRRSWK